MCPKGVALRGILNVELRSGKMVYQLSVMVLHSLTSDPECLTFPSMGILRGNIESQMKIKFHTNPPLGKVVFPSRTLLLGK